MCLDVAFPSAACGSMSGRRAASLRQDRSSVCETKKRERQTGRERTRHSHSSQYFVRGTEGGNRDHRDREQGFVEAPLSRLA